MLRFQSAFHNKYLEGKGLKSYGIKDEGNTLNIFRQNIRKSLISYKGGAAEGAASKTVAAQDSKNPLAAVFAIAAKKREEEAAAKLREERGDDSGEDVAGLDKDV